MRPPKIWGLEDELLRNFRLYVLEACYGNRVWAARVLGISLRSLRGWLAVYKRQGYPVPDNDIPREFLRMNKGEPRISKKSAEVIRLWAEYDHDGTPAESLSNEFWSIWRKYHA